MGQIYTSPKARIICGCIAKDERFFDSVKASLRAYFAKDLTSSDIYPFAHTAYYQNEMGEPLKKIFFALTGLLEIEGIFRLKIFTNKLEDKFRYKRDRRVNIDPGYILPSRLVLLSTKDFQHRIHIGGGIFAEMTLRADKDGFHPCPWTFPDFCANTYRVFLNSERRKYLAQLKKHNKAQNGEQPSPLAV